MQSEQHVQANDSDEEQDVKPDPETLSFAFPVVISHEINVPRHYVEEVRDGNIQSVVQTLNQWWNSLSDEEKLAHLEFDKNTSTSENLYYLDRVVDDDTEVLWER